MTAQDIEDFFHLECSRQGFNQHSGFNCTIGDVQYRLGEVEYIVSKTRFLIAFNFRQIVKRSTSAIGEQFTVVEDVQAKVDKTC